MSVCEGGHGPCSLFLGNKCDQIPKHFHLWRSVTLTVQTPNCITLVCVVCELWSIPVILRHSAQESVILARWLMGICLALAEAHPQCEHAQLLGLVEGLSGCH